MRLGDSSDYMPGSNLRATRKNSQERVTNQAIADGNRKLKAIR